MFSKLKNQTSRNLLIGNPDLERVKINFCDFWPGFNKHNNYFVDLLKREYCLEITTDPDFLIYSVFGNEYKKYKCTRIFYTGENVRPNFSDCDYAFTFDHIDDPRHYRLPLYAWWEDADKLIKPSNLDFEAILAQKTRFCNFVYGNPSALKRINFFKELSKYKQVDSGGILLNNIDQIITEKHKVEFIQNYKFTIAFENCEQKGYTTEKLVQPMLVYSLPIYWGNPLIDRDFNTRSFLSYYDFNSEDELIERLIDLDQNDDLYLQYLQEPYYKNNEINEYVDPHNILKHFQYIFEDSIEIIAN
jgi:hypothetical protein